MNLKTTLRNALLAFGCLCMTVPATVAQSRHQGADRNNVSRQSQTSRTPRGDGRRPGADDCGNRRGHHNNNNRPGNNNNRPGNNNNRPGNNNNRPGNNNNRPGHNNNHRPGHNRPSYDRPGGGSNRPGHNRPAYDRPGGGNNHRPGHSYGHVPPPPRPWSRPLPPPRWAPPRGLPPVGAILGLTFGSAFDASLRYLAARNYAMTGYNSNVVVLSQVPYMNYTWPEGRLLYGGSGLYGSEFIYWSPYNDTSRYNQLYGSLSATFGPPVENVQQLGGWATTWFGRGNDFITLRYEAMAGPDGMPRYYTILSLGR